MFYEFKHSGCTHQLFRIEEQAYEHVCLPLCVSLTSWLKWKTLFLSICTWSRSSRPKNLDSMSRKFWLHKLVSGYWDEGQVCKGGFWIRSHELRLGLWEARHVHYRRVLYVGACTCAGLQLSTKIFSTLAWEGHVSKGKFWKGSLEREIYLKL